MTPPVQQTFERIFASCIASDLPLREQLATVATAVAQDFPAYVVAAQSMIGRLTTGEVGTGAPGVGDPFPPFGLSDEDGQIVTLDALLEEGPLAITFLRGHWCPYCCVTAAALARMEPAIAAAGGRIVAIVPERQPYVSQLKATSGATFPFLMDLDNGYALSLGLAFWMGEEMRTLHREGGEAIALYQGNDSWMLPIPATFVVDRDGRVTARFVDPDYRNRMPITDLLEALRAAAA